MDASFFNEPSRLSSAYLTGKISSTRLALTDVTFTQLAAGRQQRQNTNHAESPQAAAAAGFGRRLEIKILKKGQIQSSLPESISSPKKDHSICLVRLDSVNKIRLICGQLSAGDQKEGLRKWMGAIRYNCNVQNLCSIDNG